MKLTIACATDDGRTLTSKHFGSARAYAIYKLNGHTCTPVSRLPNATKVEGENHGSAQKARSVTTLLADRQVQVVVAKQFGPNISRLKQGFVPVILKIDLLEEVCRKLVEHREKILAEHWKAKNRGFLLLS